MRQLILATVLSVVLLAVGNVHAKSMAKGKGMSGTYQGTIMAVNKKTVSIDIGVDKSQRIMVIVDEKTKISSGAQQGTIGDLARGQIVSVTVKNNYAVTIDVTGVVNPGS